MDRAAIYLMLTLLVVSVFRVIALEYKIGALAFIPLVASLIQTGLIYFFVFEMMFVVAILESDGSEELKKRKRYISIMRAVAAFNFLFVVAIISIGVTVIIT